MLSIRHSSTWRPQQRAVVIGAAPVPGAVPALALDGLPDRRGMARQRARGPGRGCRPAAPSRRSWRSAASPARPRCPAPVAHAVHAVVPVAGADQRHAVGAGQRDGLVEAAGAMLEQARRRAKRSAGRRRHARRAAGRGRPETALAFVQHRRIARHRDILRHGISQPDPVVRDARAHALPECGSHQCCTSPSGNWRDAARSRCARVISGRSAASAMPSCNWSRKP
jgi:hypothetical protein